MNESTHFQIISEVKLVTLACVRHFLNEKLDRFRLHW